MYVVQPVVTCPHPCWGHEGAASIFGQLVRFAVVGGLCSLLYAGVFLTVADAFLPPGRAVLAVVPAFAVAATVGFLAHGAWSFRGHGHRDRPLGRAARFATVQGAGLALNAAFTWVLADLLGLATWIPLVPSVTLTPLLTFALQRQWVFGPRGRP